MSRKETGHNKYRVYSDKEQFEVVEAQMATEALEKAACEKAALVVHEDLRLNGVIPESNIDQQGHAPFELPPMMEKPENLEDEAEPVEEKEPETDDNTRYEEPTEPQEGETEADTSTVT